VFSITPYSGDPDMYIGTNSSNLPTRRDWSSFHWASAGFGNEVVQIAAADPHACAPPCWYYIGVVGYRRNATYTIMARNRNASVVDLTGGQPVMDVVNYGEYNYYEAAFDPTQAFLEIVVSPLYGDPDAFVRLDGLPPSVTSFQYASYRAAGDEDIVIRNTDLAYNETCGLLSPGVTCVASIAVYGFNASQYVITAFSAVRRLADGLPVTAFVASAQYTYFSFQQDNPKPFAITLVPLSGDPDLFVSVAAFATRPNMTNWQWFSNSLGSELVYVNPGDPRNLNCSYPCTYYIGVYGWGGGATFSIQAAGNDVTQLFNGAPQVGFVGAKTLKYFSFLAPPTPTAM
jgi:hypothetical protein